ncbi:DUF58 domain-containing protein [Microbulbifer agarilyticus]|uniref:DUF58 domain-containing protein n=1 Tax=Microbulbifer agarilyticus TaxID=260552 RepID=UPI001C98AEFF|nr:DUF58 domain-containing protein [Microbulbifer agarilyticus]MBY6213140.1 DUF58 domain-containing protein [Microbulbifer agarilyticus]MCA0894876.1 DUF58 domain-containing protein [Microbulbifer agarilyticus]
MLEKISFKAVSDNSEAGGLLQQRWLRWLNRRLPPASTLTLNHRKLFVLPTAAGMGFLLLIVLLWLLGTNYENNLVLALVFMLVGVFVILPVHTFANLSGLKLRVQEVEPAFAGDFGRAKIVLEKTGKRSHERVRLCWPPEDGALVDIIDSEPTEVTLELPLIRRGKVRAPRIRVESRFPAGLFKCWSWVDLDVEFLVYPQAKSAGPLPWGASVGEGDQEKTHSAGGDDFAGLKSYQAGDSLRHVAWKQFAGGRDLYSKEYASGSDAHLWLDWDLLAGRELETRLSNLCAWVLEAERAQVAYGLRVPGQALAPAIGAAHRQKALTLLALFPVQGVSS